MAPNRETEIVIVGAGAAGCIMAAKLAEAGRKVVVLEAGPPWRAEDMISSQIWARRLKWGGQPVVPGGKSPVNVGFNSGHGFGGAATHHYASWLRLHAEDFRVHSLHGRSVDWPISYDDLRPYYDQVQREVGISGDSAAEVWRPAGEPYPMPPLLNMQQAKVIERGFKALNLRTAPMPRAINSVEYKGRPPCIYDGWCDAGCPTGALANPLVTYLPTAQAAGAEFRSWSSVTRLLTNDEGTRVSGVAYRNEQGEEQILQASAVVMAAFAVQTPRLLLASATEHHPTGLANSSGMVGRHLMSLPTGSVFGLFGEDTQPYMGVSAGDMVSQDAYDGKASREAFGSTTWLLAQALKPNDLLGIANARADLFGAKLHEFLAKAAQKLGVMTLICEDHPAPENRLVLTETKDRFGVPIARTEHTFSEDSLKLFQTNIAQGVKIMRAAGALEAWAGPMGTQSVYGTTRMGIDPRNSVTNSYGQAHDLTNLFIAGGSLFPTTGAVAATFTIQALALRAADFMVRNWRKL